MISAIRKTKEEGDSLGGIVCCIAHLPTGLGDPVYHKLEALLAYAMLSLPASKGFEIGAGFEAARMRGSEHNDPFEINDEGRVHTSSNHSGGTLGGISTGSPLVFRVAFKPTSSIKKPQTTLNFQEKNTTFQLPETARHDPCVAIRAVPVVEAMTALVLADALLMDRCSRLDAQPAGKAG
jgi:chorismate synthase